LAPPKGDSSSEDDGLHPRGLTAAVDHEVQTATDAQAVHNRDYRSPDLVHEGRDP